MIQQIAIAVLILVILFLLARGRNNKDRINKLKEWAEGQFDDILKAFGSIGGMMGISNEIEIERIDELERKLHDHLLASKRVRKITTKK